MKCGFWSFLRILGLVWYFKAFRLLAGSSFELLFVFEAGSLSSKSFTRRLLKKCTWLQKKNLNCLVNDSLAKLVMKTIVKKPSDVNCSPASHFMLDEHKIKRNSLQKQKKVQKHLFSCSTEEASRKSFSHPHPSQSSPQTCFPTGNQQISRFSPDSWSYFKIASCMKQEKENLFASCSTSVKFAKHFFRPGWRRRKELNEYFKYRRSHEWVGGIERKQILVRQSRSMLGEGNERNGNEDSEGPQCFYLLLVFRFY